MTSSPTVVDGTIFVGSDTSLVAIDVGTGSSSEGSRAMHATLGHHDEWRHADQTIDQTADPASETEADSTESTPENATDSTGSSTESDQQPAETDDATIVEIPGFGAGHALAAIGSVGYVLRRRSSGE